MKALPPDYTLLREIGYYAEELLNSIQKAEVARLSDLYDYLCHKPEMIKAIGSSKEFSQFMRRMHDEHNDVFKAFIPTCIVDTSTYHHYQWYFYPPIKPFEVNTDGQVLSEDVPEDTFKYFKRSKIYQAYNGVMVRSKAELYILTRLLDIHHFTVHYERPLAIDGQRKYPDFTILNEETDTVFYWEHFGMSEDPEYFDQMNEKLEWYTTLGFESIDDGGTLIVTAYCEDPHQLTSQIEDIILKMDRVVVPGGYL